MSNQRLLWDKLHKTRQVSLGKQTNFAKEVQKIIPTQSKLLELGCGNGKDAFYFAQNGHKVTATDFSEVAIENNKKKYNSRNLQFELLDISKPFNFPDNSFDVIYARLSFHYFTDNVTKEIFKELNRILKPNGLLCFICKSTTDPLYGKGEKIEEDMFEENGHIRHFFSQDYIKECLKGLFTIQKLELGEENFYNSPSTFVKVIATS